jgi:hypothetical protein
VRNVPLAERRADAQALDAELKAHRRNCNSCRGGGRRPCERARELASEVAAIRGEIRHWFDPGPDQMTL